VSEAAGGLLEQLGSVAVGQPGPAGDRAQVGGATADGFAAGEEHRVEDKAIRAVTDVLRSQLLECDLPAGSTVRSL
jgi:hypothetical protein